MRSIPYATQDINQDDIDAVSEVLKSGWLTQGPAVPRFEQAVASYCGVSHASAVCNATAALHLACRALGLGAGDALWTSPNTFVASANCALYCGAGVDFVDIDARSYNMSVEALRAKLASAEKAGKLPKIVVPVHFSGQPCEMAPIRELAQRYDFAVVEDASHAVGARYRDSRIGDCACSDVAVFSFHPVKILTTGEGGMLLSKRPNLDASFKLLRSHGVTRNQALMDAPPHGPWYYQQLELGYNYRLTDIQAALGVSQLARLEDFLARRRAIAARYHEKLAGLPLVLPYQHPDCHSSWHLYVIRVPAAKGRSRDQVMAGLRQAGINANVHYIPVHTQPYYRKLGFRHGDFPQAEAYYAEAISLPMYYGLSDDDQDTIAERLRALLS
mgnify:CR=1 FL=1